MFTAGPQIPPPPPPVPIIQVVAPGVIAPAPVIGGVAAAAANAAVGIAVGGGPLQRPVPLLPVMIAGRRTRRSGILII